MKFFTTPLVKASDDLKRKVAKQSPEETTYRETVAKLRADISKHKSEIRKCEIKIKQAKLDYELAKEK